MANPQTAEEWKQVAADASAQIKELTAQQATATANEIAAVAAAQAEYNRLVAFSSNPKNFDLKTPEGIAAFKEAKAAAKSYKDNQLNSALEAESNAQQQFTSQINQLRQTQSNADRQASAAASGAPQTSSNPAPANPAPGNNTTVTTTTAPTIENSIPADTTNPNTDPNTNTGNEDIAEAQRQAEVQAIAQQDAEAQQIAEQQYVDNEPASAGGSGASIENANPTFVDPNEDPFEQARIAREEEANNTTPRTEEDVIGASGGMKGLQGSVDATRGKQISQDAENAKTKGDWRVRLSLAKSAGYLYKAENPGILKYLQETDGVVFPYTPAIQITYAANYETADIVHSNYKLYQYKNSAVDQIAITCDFTAQDTYEANYLLAVIHFFKSVTKMFYGQDQLPKPGTPPPLCYLTGLGTFQFDNHPLVITNFNYNLPNDVDYIRAGSPTLEPGVNSSGYGSGLVGNDSVSCRRLEVNGLNFGGTEKAPNWQKATNTQPTYVPTKMQIVLSAYPIVTRNDISNKFSLKDYATGSLLQGSKRNGGGIW